MKKISVALALMALTVTGCSKGQALEVTKGSDVTLQKKDGVTVAGRLVEVKPNQVVVETASGEKTPVARADIASLRADVKPADTPVPARSEPAKPGAEAPDPRPEYREVTLPAGTVLPVALQTAVGSDTSRVEDAVRGTLRRAVTVGGVQVLPAGTALLGHVTSAERSGRVKGRAHVAFRFTRLDPPGEAERVTIQTATISRLAPATKKQDAAKIGGGAAGGAIIGGILGGGDGAAKGAAVGGAAGTGVVLSTRGKEVRLTPGADLSVRLQAPVKVRVLVRK
jgi:outer membrane lipoprotein SlyB